MIRLFKSGGALLIGLALTFTLPLHAAQTWKFSGEARNQDGKLLYNERHSVSGQCIEGHWQPRTHEVRYHKPGAEEPFAIKDLDYSESALRPQFELQQSDFDERMLVRNQDDERLIIDWRTHSGETEEFSVTVTDRVVVDAGFDNLVRQKWPRVSEGKDVTFSFLAPTRGEHYGFILEPASSTTVDAPFVLRIRPTGLIARFLVDPIVLGYSESGALTDYLGLTNIRRDEDGNYTAHIQYQQAVRPDCALVR